MTKWLKRMRSAVFTGLAWAAVWAPIGVLVGLIVDPDESMDEMWVAIGAYPGFLCGAVFSAILELSLRRGRFYELPIWQVGTGGAASGVLVGAVPLIALASDGARGLRGWALGILVLGSFTLLSAVSAVGSLAVAKLRHRKNSSKTPAT